MTSLYWRDLSASSKPYAEVIGDPIVHSKSPLIHEYWLQKRNIDAAYRAAHVPPEELGAYFKARRRDSFWRGCNVTVPHKSAVLNHVRSYGPDVDMIGAANTIGNRADGGLFAENTDWRGFLTPLEPADLTGKRVAIYGAGGAARAILYALTIRQAGFVSIINRTRERAEELLQDLPVNGDVMAPEDPLPGCDILINTTSLGMTGSPPLAPDLDVLPANALVYDIVYTPLETDLLRIARRRGLRTINGLPMFIGQAHAAFPTFFETGAPAANDPDLMKILTG